MSISCYEQVYNSSISNKLGHAFLIESNDIEESVVSIKNLLKKLNCPNEYNDECDNDCNLCYQIANDFLPSIKIIESKTSTINKDQIVSVKQSFLSNSMFSKYNAYIIKEADKLNSTSANILLKFLEEPDTRTLAFFITKNSKNVLPTIKSRCQLLKDNFYETFWQSHSIIEEQYQEYLLIANKMMDYSGGLWLEGKKLLKGFLNDKSAVQNILQILLDEYSKKYKELILEKKKKELDFVSSKVKIINKTLANLTYNVNIELAMDDFLIKMGEEK